MENVQRKKGINVMFSSRSVICMSTNSFKIIGKFPVYANVQENEEIVNSTFLLCFTSLLNLHHSVALNTIDV